MPHRSFRAARFSTVLLSCLVLCAYAPAQDEEGAACYLGVEFVTSPIHMLLLRVEVDEESLAYFGPGEKAVATYPEGTHKITISSTKSSGKPGGTDKFSLDLKPFVYTKIVIDEVPAKKKKGVRLRVKIFENGEQVRTRTLNL